MAAAPRPRVLFLGPANSPVAVFLRDERGCTVISTEDPLDVDYVREQRFDWLVSFGYRHIVRPPVIALFTEARRVNLHISLLPYNRGADPNLWSILDYTPSGVTIHVLDEGLDTGKIVAQRALNFDDEVETLASSYAKLQAAMVALFKETWPAMAALVMTEQDSGRATLHRVADKKAFFDYVTPQGWDTARATVKARFGDWCALHADSGGHVFKE